MSKRKKPTITQANITKCVKAAATAGRVIVTIHASGRGRQRNITDKQMRDVARYGAQVITEPAAKKGLNPNTRMRRRVGGENITIIASIIETENGEHAVVVSSWK